MTPAEHAATDYRVLTVDVLGSRGGMTRQYTVVAGRWGKELATFTTRREALLELARLVNEAHA